MRGRGVDPAGRKIVRGDDGTSLRTWFESEGIPFRTVDMTLRGGAIAN